MTGGLRRGLAATGLAVCIALFASLGVWQVNRLAWKTQLIATVQARTAADPVDAPAPAAWPNVTQTTSEYSRVTVTGTYNSDAEVLVQAVTDLGPGFWVVTPLKTDAGWTVLINRGFVGTDQRDPTLRSHPTGAQTITGLLRLSQPGGAFLRANDPFQNRWYSRDTAAIAIAQNLGTVAPYFIDANKRDPLPVGGLTIVTFRNAHLSYALTWFVLAFGLTIAGVFTLRRTT